MKLTVVGCGDAFGSGGRLQTCYHVETSQTRFIIDCGATTLIGFNKLGIDPNTIETIFISHLHGDHFAGLVWWLVHAQHVAKRTSPLTVVGPEGVQARFEAAAEVLFPGSTGIQRRYDLRYLEMTREKPMHFGSVQVTPFEVKHPCGAPPYALRLECEGNIIAYSGDTEWTDALIDAGRGADLFIVECLMAERRVKFHMDYPTLSQNLPRVGARRVILTHLGPEMLARLGDIPEETAEDGKVIEL